ncbi:MAG: Unknown protein, partial [uncultured Thiotrichaceae bacterium]
NLHTNLFACLVNQLTDASICVVCDVVAVSRMRIIGGFFFASTAFFINLQLFLQTCAFLSEKQPHYPL